MPTEHTIKAFDRELSELRRIVSVMGDLATEQLSLLMKAIAQTDVDLATRVVEREPEADRLEHEIETMVIRLLALRHPAAGDLCHWAIRHDDAQGRDGCLQGWRCGEGAECLGPR